MHLRTLLEHPTTRRWLTVVTYGLIAGTTVYVALPFLAVLADRFVDCLATLSSPVHWLLAISILLATLFRVYLRSTPREQSRDRKGAVLPSVSDSCRALRETRKTALKRIRIRIRRRQYNLFGLRSLPFYPPPIVAVTIALFWCCFLHSLDSWRTGSTGVHPSRAHGGAFCAAIVMVLISLLGWFILPRSERRKKARRLPESLPKSAALPQNFDELLRWFADDKELKTSDPAYFEHQLIAARIARRLANQKGGENSSIAVVGAKGSGKSSIAVLVEKQLRQNPEILFARVSLWPFDTLDGAIRGILGKIDEELRRHVSTLALANIPGAYLDAIGGAGSYGRFFGSLLSHRSEPKHVLEHVDDIASAIGKRLVVWIEDFERFHPADRSPDDRTDHRADDLNRIRAFLYLLDQQESVTVIMASESLDARFDIDKIARFVERIPPLPATDVLRTVKLFRDACLGDRPEAIVDPALDGIRERWELPEDHLQDFHESALDKPDQPNNHMALAALLQTPRGLKSAFRAAWEVWEVLCGEIDFDDLLVMSVIKTAAPPVFDFVEDSVRFMRRSENPKAPELESLLQRFQQETGTPPAAIKELLSSVFPAADPGLAEPGNAHSLDTYRRFKPQGFHGAVVSWHRHRDYWRTYLNAQPILETETDQAAIKSIRAWKKSADYTSELVERLRTDGQDRQVLQLGRLLDSGDVLRLLDHLAQSAAHNTKLAGVDRSVRGFDALSQLLCEQNPTPSGVKSRILHALEESSRENLLLADHLLALANPFRSRNQQPSTDENEQLQADLRGAIHAHLLEWFPPGSAGALLAALPKGNMFLLTRLCRFPEGELTPWPETPPFEGWSRFATVLVDAAQENEAKMIPQLLRFVAKLDTNSWQAARHLVGNETKVFTYSGEPDFVTAQRLFGPEFKRLIDILADASCPEDLERGMPEVFEKVKAEADHRRGDPTPPRPRFPIRPKCPGRDPGTLIQSEHALDPPRFTV